MKNQENKKDLKKELIRDFLALGSWVFYILVIGRALIEPFRPFADQMIIAGIFLIIINLILIYLNKQYDSYTSKALIIAYFTIIFYNNFRYSIFAVLAVIGILISSYYTGNSKTKIFYGLIIGIVAILIGKYLSGFSIGL